MTAFGRGQALGENEDFLVEIHSVNSRRLEIVINMPGDLTEFDPALRKLIRGAISRGHVTVFVSCQPAHERGRALRVNTEMAKQLKRAYDELRKTLHYDGEVDFSIIASHHDLVVPGNRIGDAQGRWAGLNAAADKALGQLIAMKETEGENLRGAFEDDLNHLQAIVASVEQLAPAALLRHKEGLNARVREVASDLPDNQERLLREVVILAQKLDISEEITRLKSHISQFRSLMEDAESSGRTMDFVVQEMNREINTIGAKADDLDISGLVVRAKTQLAKLREQSQNIE